ncbi:uncharacterized protein LOC134282490 [Saccostrea cucullata]|uniref:uncharacterized protein LOC134282490 n=1 Tax=Saccostrea cuccullata TaxID=36930 RepID=UPI002ED10C0B
MKDRDLIFEFTSHCTKISSDTESEIERKLIGRCVEVNVKNLVAPHPLRCLRSIDRKHVESLKESFKTRPENSVIFFGIVFGENIDLNDLNKIGSFQIETIGGNHSRIALQELFDEGLLKEPTIHVKLYKNLTDTEALKLGFDHNVSHELAKPTSAEELLFLFRRELQKKVTEEEMSSPQASKLKMWKETCASILGISKTKLHNVYHCMLSLCLSSKNGWKHIEDFVSSWHSRNLKKIPKGEIKKTHFTKMSGPTEEERNSLLVKLMEGEIDWVEFNRSCASKKKSSKAKTRTVEGEKAQTPSPKEGTPMSEQSETEDVHPNQEKVLENKIKVQQQTEERLRKEILDLENVIQLQAADIKKLEISERKVNYAEDEIKELLRENKMQSEKIKSLTNEILDLKNIRKVKQELEDQNRQLIKENEELKEQLNSVQKRKFLDQEEASTATGKKKQKTHSAQPVKTSQTCDMVTIAVVEYNKKVYLGEIVDGETITFAQKPLGKLDAPINWNQLEEKSFTLNLKDKAKLDSRFVVCTMECAKEKNRLVLCDSNKKIIDSKKSTFSNQ